MADLYPIPFETLVRTMARDLTRGTHVYMLPRKQWWTADPARDVSVTHLGQRMATPVGPASGPHTQLAQNLVLSWLAGGRFMELKTVQILDTLAIPRPCIHVPHIGYNVEWSQELLVPESAEEYVKGWWLLHMLASEHGPGLWDGVGTLFDISLGYDLAGIQTEKVAGFVRIMQDATEVLARLKAELPDDLAAWRDVPVPANIANSITLSTFHGCPADEIEAIATHTMRHHGLHTVIKLNPTLLGYERVVDIVNHKLGYDFIQLDEAPFDADLKWGQLMDMLPRLEKVAAECGVELGVKFSNTLVSRSPEPPFGEGEMYVSGPPLHVLAATLAAEFSQATGGRIPITFSAGVDAKNFPGLVAGGLAAVTTCSDLLKSKGYGRMSRYLKGLEKDMKSADASNIDEYRAAKGGAAVALATLGETVVDDARYHRAQNVKTPKKLGSELELFNCVTCDICLPVCPNAANFRIDLPQGQWLEGILSWDGEGRHMHGGDTLVLDQRHQIGTLVDACNECGQCDVWCPEDGGPYVVKPNLFLSERAFLDKDSMHGFHVDADRAGIRWRRGEEMFHYREEDGGSRIVTSGGHIRFAGPSTITETVGCDELDLTVVTVMRMMLDALRDGRHSTFFI
jgi:putative selenate reductase